MKEFFTLDKLFRQRIVFASDRMILKARSVLILLLLCSVLLSTVNFARPSSVGADEQAAVLDFPVSPANDPDPRNETSIAVSPRNEQIIVGASKVIIGGGSAAQGNTRVAYYYSSDGGRTWGTGLLTLETPQKIWGRASDPSVAVDTDGNFYLCALMLDNSSFDSSVNVFKSTDGGRTFADPAPAVVDIGSGTNPKLADKCLITTDSTPASRFKNTVYAIWTSTERDDNGQNAVFIRLSWRRPGDAGFGAPKTVSHPGDMRGPSITTGPDGEVYAAWEGIGNPKVILFNASTDGGETFLPGNVAPSIDFNIHNYVGSLTQPGASLQLNGIQRMNSHPIIDVDRSNGPNRGMIYVAWAETTNRADSDVFVLRMPPPGGGRPEVRSPIRVNDDVAGADQFFPWLSVDSTNGAVEVAFYDRRNDSAELLMNMYVARSTNAGASFGENIRVSAESSNPRIQADVAGTNGNQIGIGDYVALTAVRGKAHLMWTDTRRLKQEIFYGHVAFDSAGRPPPGGDFGTCQNPRPITSVPYQDQLDTRAATSMSGLSCSGAQDTNSVWYMVTPAVDTVYGVDTVGSDYDTVLGVFTGTCSGGLLIVACSDDFGNAISAPNRSMLTFSARAGVTYLIEVSGKGSGGSLQVRFGFPTITGVQYTSAPDDSDALRITGAGFVIDNVTVIVQKDGEDTPLSRTFFTADRQGDGTTTTFFAMKKKLKKLIKRGNTVIVRIESPAGSGRLSVPFFFTR